MTQLKTFGGGGGGEFDDIGDAVEEEDWLQQVDITVSPAFNILRCL